MTTVYFVRHAETDNKNHSDADRPLSLKGKNDTKLVTDYLEDKDIQVIISSPFKRAVETVRGIAAKKGLDIKIYHDFRERKIDSYWIEDFNQFARKQWEDFNYKRNDGECLKEVQIRNIQALNNVLHQYENKNIVIGSHGTALSTIINYYDKCFGYHDFESIRPLMPWIAKFTFEGKNCVSIHKVNLFSEINEKQS